MNTGNRPKTRTSNRKGKSKSQVRSDETDRNNALQRSASSGNTRYQRLNAQRSKSSRRSNPIQQSSTEQMAITNYNPCVTGPDIYTNVLGPTADETILVGLETFMRFCQDCPSKYEENALVESSPKLSSSEDLSEEEVENGLTEDFSELEERGTQQHSDQNLSQSIRETTPRESVSVTGIETFVEEYSYIEPFSGSVSATKKADASSSAVERSDGSRISTTRSADESRINKSGITVEDRSANKSGIEATDKSETTFREGDVDREESHAPDSSGRHLTVPGVSFSNISDRKSPSRDISRATSPGKELSRMSRSRDISERMEKSGKSISKVMYDTTLDDKSDYIARDLSGRAIPERGSAYRGVSEKNASGRVVSIKEFPTENPISISRDISVRSATASRVSSRTGAQSATLARLSREQSIPEELSDTFEKFSKEELLDELEMDDEEKAGFAKGLTTRHTSSRIIESENTRPSTHTTEQPSDNLSFSQESQTAEQTASMQGVSSSQTSEHSLTTASQTGETSSSHERQCTDTTWRVDEVQLYQIQTEDGQLGKGRTKSAKDSTDTCRCCPCTQIKDTSRPTVKINVCKCSACKKQVQKPSVKRSCLKAAKCQCCPATTAARYTTSSVKTLNQETTSTSKSTNNIPRKRQVKLRCQCCASDPNSVPSESPIVSNAKSANNIPQKRQVKLSCECSDSVPNSVPSESPNESPPSQMGDTSNECNSLCYQVRYAITKITKFYSYTTFEVMRSTSKRPKVMPKSLEGVFVLKNAGSKSGSSQVT